MLQLFVITLSQSIMAMCININYIHLGLDIRATIDN